MDYIPRHVSITPIQELVDSPTKAISECVSDRFHHVVIDLETLSLRTDAAIVSIGAVALDSNLKVCGQFHCHVDIQECLAQGMRVDADTLSWWIAQEEMIRNSLHTKGFSLDLAIDSFSWWLNIGNEECDPRSRCQIWANGPEFDCSILKEAFFRIYSNQRRSFSIWNYQNVQSIRTLWLLNEKFKLGCKYTDDLPKHNALFDAYREALFVRDVLRALGRISRRSCGK